MAETAAVGTRPKNQIHDFRHLRDTLENPHSEQFWDLYDNKVIFFPSATKAQLEKMQMTFKTSFTYRPARTVKFRSARQTRTQMIKSFQDRWKEQGLSNTEIRKKTRKFKSFGQERESTIHSFPGGNVRFFRYVNLDDYFPGLRERMGVRQMGPLMTLGSNPKRSHENNAEDFLQFALLVRRLGVEAKIVSNGHVWHINPPKTVARTNPKTRR